jgi:DNA-binding NarL/FixJ family response regulator
MSPKLMPQPRLESRPRVVLIGSRLFNIRMMKALTGEPSFEVAAGVESAKEAVAAATLHRAELAIVEIGVAGVAERVMLARRMVERAPGCGIMLICGAFTESVARMLWVYGTESWSVLTGASSKNAAQVVEAVNSALRGMIWVEPGVRRALTSFGPRPKSLDERRLLMLDGSGGAGAVAA